MNGYFWLGFLLGLFIGGNVGLLVVAVLRAAKDKDNE